MNSIKQFLICLARDNRGSILTTESTLIAAVLLIGTVTGLTTVRDTIISEISDVAGGLQDINQEFQYVGLTGHSSSTRGSDFDDALDFCDSAEDIANQADNCITFDGPPVDETTGEGGIFVASFEDIDTSDAVRTFGRRAPHAYLFESENVAGWETTALDGLIEIWDSGFRGVDSQNGDYHAEINANVDAQLYQDIIVSPGDEVEYSIWHRGRHGVDVANVMIGPPGMQSVDQTMSTDNTAWVNYTGTFTVPAGVTTLRIGFEAVSTANGGTSAGNFIDNFEVSISN